MNDSPNGSPFLEKQPNFRSLEGIPAAGGRKFKKNMVYRSGGLGWLDEADLRKLEQIGLALVIDFRSDRELADHPSKPIPGLKKTLRIVIADEARDRAMNFLENNDAEGLEKVLITDYSRMIRKDSERFADFFRILEQTTDFPLVFHCAAGKDRTGIASVLLLSALGADLETVKKDYFMSNERLKSYAERFIRQINEEGKNGEIIRPMMEVRPEYLQSALDEIDRSFGGMSRYLFEVLKVDSELLKAKYLE